MKNPRVRRGKEILKIRAEINAKETKETIAKINKARPGARAYGNRALSSQGLREHTGTLPNGVRGRGVGVGVSPSESWSRKS